ncbi:MAG: hypothetical protein Q4G16_11325 [Cruoricaptor ignavus]|nr:hypothetical protein [Cruoricaptor ignavus]
MKISLVVLFLAISFHLSAQGDCAVKNSTNYPDLKIVNAEEIKCIAKSNKNQSLFYTFGIWCMPCVLHLDGALEFAKIHNLSFYVILIEDDKSENSRIDRAVDFLKRKNKDIDILLISNEYSSKPRVKNKKFLTEITPKEFENIDDMSKYILINSEGEVQMVTSYKDYQGDDWRDDSGKRNRKLLPLIAK